MQLLFVVEVSKAESVCAAEGCPFPSVEVDVLLLRLCSHMVDILLLHARLHHYSRVPVFPFQASAVLRHRRTGKPIHPKIYVGIQNLTK